MKTAVAAALAASLACAGVAAADTSVQVNQVRRVAFNGAAADVVVGNPEIADVTVVDGRNVFVTGRSVGATSLVVLDGAGRVIFNDNVVVASPLNGAGVSMTRGAATVDVVCNPRCQPNGGGSSGAGVAPSANYRAAAPAATSASQPVALPPPPAGASAGGTVGPS